MWAAILPYLYQAAATGAASYGFSKLNQQNESSTSPGAVPQMQTPDVIGSLMQYMKQGKGGM